MTVIGRWTPEDYERMADAILRGDTVRLGASGRDVQDAAEIALDRIREQLRGAVSECERLRNGLRAALDYLQLNDSIDYNTALTRVRAALEEQ